MDIKINDKILCIPPYLSTKWTEIASLSVKGNKLEISLHNGNLVAIPELAPEIIERVFSQHAAFVEKGSSTFLQNTLVRNEQLNKILNDSEGPTIRFGFGSMDEFGNLGQHNPNQSDAPDLPQEILEKIAAISKILSSEEITLPTAAPSCNCFYCQIARTVNPSIAIQETQETSVSDEELHFREWNIQQLSPNLYSVTNCVDQTESYNVFLGDPIGCTCGQQGCEHIIAVLKS